MSLSFSSPSPLRSQLSPSAAYWVSTQPRPTQLSPCLRLPIGNKPTAPRPYWSGGFHWSYSSTGILFTSRNCAMVFARGLIAIVSLWILVRRTNGMKMLLIFLLSGMFCAKSNAQGMNAYPSIPVPNHHYPAYQPVPYPSLQPYPIPGINAPVPPSAIQQITRPSTFCVQRSYGFMCF